MRVLITGSFRQHNDETFDDAMNSAELVSGITPTSITTGCWVGVDQLAKDYAKRNKLPFDTINMSDVTRLPSNIEAIILISCHGEFDGSEILLRLANASKLPVVIW